MLNQIEFPSKTQNYGTPCANARAGQGIDKTMKIREAAESSQSRPEKKA
jgi:hypothetical protein